ncbi:hypothetical protein AHAT_38220 [Agarivorans sp. Toyoura001]|uniref:flagellar protein FliT n=1 Tax=Agarivorans sp. Toyoura001 TaxID=2283141 RepID=UPI0010E600D2|nr:flagellar protein FliT [Agarivorans sp. Toyoura001]GDY27932.1 hypothetical protein AHAT_38220 [Agarivorans sp. Toyoura001]
MNSSNNELSSKVSSARLLLESLQLLLTGDEIDMQLVNKSLDEHQAILTTIFEGKESLTFSSDELSLLTGYLNEIRMVFNTIEGQRSETSAKLGSIRRGQKVVGAYFQNT